jgi:DNA-binding response OmpR family regulator
MTILLVDDDPAVRAYVREALGIAGFTILEAADGNEALRIAETTRRPIEMLVTDINMPGIDGLELARRVQTLRPDTSVLYMSGAPAEFLAARGTQTGTVFLRKPFGPDVLLERVHDAMRASAATRSTMPIGRG